MMKLESSIFKFAPVVGLIKSCALFQARHHAQHPPCTGFARDSGVQIANCYINGLHRYFVLNETAEIKELYTNVKTCKYQYVRVHTDMYTYILLDSFMYGMYWYVPVHSITYSYSLHILSVVPHAFGGWSTCSDVR